MTSSHLSCLVNSLIFLYFTEIINLILLYIEYKFYFCNTSLLPKSIENTRLDTRFDMKSQVFIHVFSRLVSFVSPLYETHFTNLSRTKWRNVRRSVFRGKENRHCSSTRVHTCRGVLSFETGAIYGHQNPSQYSTHDVPNIWLFSCRPGYHDAKASLWTEVSSMLNEKMKIYVGLLRTITDFSL